MARCGEWQARGRGARTAGAGGFSFQSEREKVKAVTACGRGRAHEGIYVGRWKRGRKAGGRRGAAGKARSVAGRLEEHSRSSRLQMEMLARLGACR